MKLTKKELFSILDAIIQPLGISYKTEELAKEAYDALCYNKLEIEGYQRAERAGDKWIKLDKNDLKTFPQRDVEEVLLYVSFDNGEKTIIQATVIWLSNKEFYFSDFNGDEVHDNVYDITHWRPLPKPPAE